jgi:hypothetical protein
MGSSRSKASAKGERTPKKFSRKFAVDDRTVETAKITATLLDGTLEISAPKKRSAGPRKLSVKTDPPSETEPPFNIEVDILGSRLKTSSLSFMKISFLFLDSVNAAVKSRKFRVFFRWIQGL